MLYYRVPIGELRSGPKSSRLAGFLVSKSEGFGSGKSQDLTPVVIIVRSRVYPNPGAIMIYLIWVLILSLNNLELLQDLAPKGKVVLDLRYACSTGDLAFKAYVIRYLPPRVSAILCR